MDKSLFELALYNIKKVQQTFEEGVDKLATSSTIGANPIQPPEATSMSEKAGHHMGYAAGTTSELGSESSQKAMNMANKAGETLKDVQNKASEIGQSAKEKAQHSADMTKETLHQTQDTLQQSAHDMKAGANVGYSQGKEETAEVTSSLGKKMAEAMGNVKETVLSVFPGHHPSAEHSPTFDPHIKRQQEIHPSVSSIHESYESGKEAVKEKVSPSPSTTASFHAGEAKAKAENRDPGVYQTKCVINYPSSRGIKNK
ncbi:hypothetical protein O9G_004776 [Rozella allomycis CSF55]|uniref:Uncharacterized protein n=1 Tax=Rozella allomycis (strain CSF55) TaxID=988480 RepID=A0A075ARG8_ROZAC|nr:hypothetical protein O9G_004776 [Rozella allomycis CSF55]|eukprot:EPZ32891.1 hypothetical protein O9G_004776 [Rozella allomycis CSF55]